MRGTQSILRELSLRETWSILREPQSDGGIAWPLEASSLREGVPDSTSVRMQMRVRTAWNEAHLE